MKQKDRGLVYIERDLLTSEAWKSLTAHAKSLLIEFLMRRQLKKVRLGASASKSWIVINNGKIILTYADAKSILGWSAPKFTRYRDELIAKGFLDVLNPGGNFEGCCALYAVPGKPLDKHSADRWQAYGTVHFQEVIRPPDSKSFKGRGFKDYWIARKGGKVKPLHGKKRFQRGN